MARLVLGTVLGAVFTLRRFVVAYDHVSDAAIGRVPRVYVRQFADLTRHRAVAH